MSDEKSKVPENIVQETKHAAPADIVHDVSVRGSRGEGFDGSSLSREAANTLETITHIQERIDQLAGVYDLDKMLTIMHNAVQDRVLSNEDLVDFKRQIAEKMTNILVTDARFSSTDPELLIQQLEKYAHYSFLSDEQRHTVEAAIHQRKEFNLATASVVDIKSRFDENKFRFSDIEAIQDSTYLRFIADSLMDQISAGAHVDDNGRLKGTYLLDDRNRRFGEELLEAVLTRLDDMKHPFRTFTRNMMRIADQLITK